MYLVFLKPLQTLQNFNFLFRKELTNLIFSKAKCDSEDGRIDELNLQSFFKKLSRSSFG